MSESALRPAPPLEDLRFFARWLRRPGRIGAVVPSSEALAKALAEQVDAQAPGVVVELGPGTGSVTQALFAAGVPEDGLVAIEREAPFCALLAKRFPNLRVVQGDACELEALLVREGIGPVKAVVSSLPLIGFSMRDQRQIMGQVFSVLDPGGVLIQYTYGLWSPLPAALRAELGIKGGRTDWVLANLPPAAVWRFRRKETRADMKRAALLYQRQ